MSIQYLIEARMEGLREGDDELSWALVCAADLDPVLHENLRRQKVEIAHAQSEYTKTPGH